jgi:RIO kinase 2
MGSKNHEVVPSTLIAQVSGLRNGGVNKILGVLAKRNLVAKMQNSKCEFLMAFWTGLLTTDAPLDDGYRLTYGGYDFLAIRALSKRDSMYSVGNQIGVGKESGLLFLLFDNRLILMSHHKISILSQTPRDVKWF